MTKSSKQPSHPIGLGDPNSQFNVYIGNRPDYQDMSRLQFMRPLESGDIAAIGQHCGNGWRKVFNVYAKLAFALDCNQLCQNSSSWQGFRQQYLLQAHSNTALHFSPPNLLAAEPQHSGLHLIMGKHHALSLDLSFNWLDEQFAIHPEYPCMVCPYFDYRQLSNAKILHLITLLQQYYPHKPWLAQSNDIGQ